MVSVAALRPGDADRPRGDHPPRRPRRSRGAYLRINFTRPPVAGGPSRRGRRPRGQTPGSGGLARGCRRGAGDEPRQRRADQDPGGGRGGEASVSGPGFDLIVLDADGTRMWVWARARRRRGRRPRGGPASAAERGTIENPLNPGRYFVNCWMGRESNISDLATEVLEGWTSSSTARSGREVVAGRPSSFPRVEEPP